MSHPSTPNLRHAIGRGVADFRKLLANPVVVRDLRAQMRSVKSFAFIGAYLLLLSVLAVAGYASSTGQGLNPLQWSDTPRNIVDAQANLEQFRAFIFGTLALLVTLIAPALTAASVVGERQRQSFDLLVTTPLTASQLLVGKLVSSVAFLGFLLLLSLPATALCVVLGGSTPGDVLRYYFLLAVDGVVLSAIGLYFSCTARLPLAATVWTVLGVLGFLLVTLALPSMLANALAPRGPIYPLPLEPFLSVAWLNPALAIMSIANPPGSETTVFLRLVVFLGLATLVTRVLLAAATYRLGLFGAGSALSLRRQSLLLTAVLVGLFANALARTPLIETPGMEQHWRAAFGNLFVLALLMVAPFLPGLFVPARPEDAPPGLTEETASAPGRDRPFALRRLLYPEHSGALPWYVAYVLIVLGATLGGMFFADRAAAVVEFLPMALSATAYLLGVGFLFWSLSRLSARLAADLSSARGLAFALLVAVVGLPTLLLSLSGTDWQNNPLVGVYLLSPALHGDAPSMLLAFLRSAVLAASLGILALLAESWRRSASPAAVGTR